MDNDKRFEDNALQRIEAQRENSERGEEAAAESAGRIGRRIRMRIIGEKGGMHGCRIECTPTRGKI